MVTRLVACVDGCAIQGRHRGLPLHLKIPEVEVTPRGYPFDYVHGRCAIQGAMDSGLEERILPSIRRSQILLITPTEEW